MFLKWELELGQLFKDVPREKQTNKQTDAEDISLNLSPEPLLLEVFA